MRQVHPCENHRDHSSINRHTPRRTLRPIGHAGGYARKGALSMLTQSNNVGDKSIVTTRKSGSRAVVADRAQRLRRSTSQAADNIVLVSWRLTMIATAVFGARFAVVILFIHTIGAATNTSAGLLLYAPFGIRFRFQRVFLPSSCPHGRFRTGSR